MPGCSYRWSMWPVLLPISPRRKQASRPEPGREGPTGLGREGHVKFQTRCIQTTDSPRKGLQGVSLKSMLKTQNDPKPRGGMAQALGSEVRGPGCFSSPADLSHSASCQHHQGTGHMLAQVGHTPAQAGTQRHMLAQAGTHQHRLAQDGTHWHRPAHTGTRWDR